MKPSVFFYNLCQGFKNIFRHGVMSTASVLVLVGGMILCGTFYIAIDTIDRNFNNINNLNVIEVRMNKEYTDEQIAAIGEKLREICDDSDIMTEGDTGEKVRFISADEHLEIMRAQGNSEWIDGLFDDTSAPEGDMDNHFVNPLRASYRLYFKNLSDFDAVTRVRNRIDSITLTSENGTEFDAVPTEDIMDYIDLYGNVMNVKKTLYIAGIWLLAILLLISLFAIMNTVKLGVFSRRNEITFMRLCGATKHFIRMPYIVEGIIIGLFSACVAFGIEFYIYQYLLRDIVSSTLGSAEAVLADFSEYSMLLIAGYAAIGLFTGIVSSSLSLKKYLKA